MQHPKSAGRQSGVRGPLKRSSQDVEQFILDLVPSPNN